MVPDGSIAVFEGDGRSASWESGIHQIQGGQQGHGKQQPDLASTQFNATPRFFVGDAE